MSKAAKKSDKPQGKDFGVILAPVITEKATMASSNNQVAFYIAPTATKQDVKTAVERIFKVKVEGVNTSITKGKRKSFRGVTGKRVNRKKAIVRLAEGQSIDIAAGA